MSFCLFTNTLIHISNAGCVVSCLWGLAHLITVYQHVFWRVKENLHVNPQNNKVGIIIIISDCTVMHIFKLDHVLWLTGCFTLKRKQYMYNIHTNYMLKVINMENMKNYSQLQAGVGLGIYCICMHVPYRCSLGLGRFEQDSDGCCSFIQKGLWPIVLIYCGGWRKSKSLY